MADRSKSQTGSSDVRIVADRTGARIRTLVCLTATVVIIVGSMLLFSGGARPTDAPADRVVARDSAGSVATPPVERTAKKVDVRAVRIAEGSSVPKPQAADATNGPADAPPAIDAGDYIAALRANGETEGLAAFNPPGTRPPNAGVVVPEDYVLPEGFMRHYQSTDDGGRLAAILTLSPDYELVDADGNAIALGRDRIVPPELVPPDLPVRILEIPSASGGTPGRR
jgi:hypothetical protein